MSKAPEIWTEQQISDWIPYGEGHIADHVRQLQAKLSKMQEVVDAAWVVRDGWVGQHEMGERWHDEAKDVEALSEALAKLDKETK